MLISEIYRALADESRLRIVNALQHGVFNVQELTSILGLSQSTISHHLKVLLQTGFVHAEKTGTWAYYRIRHHKEPSLPVSSISTSLLSILSSSIAGDEESAFSADNRAIKNLLDSRRDEAKAFFDKAAPDWKNLRAEVQGGRSYFNEVIETFSSSDDLLELGCGAGAFLDAITPRDSKTIGVDYSEAMLDSARKILGARGSRVDLRLGYLEHLPIGDSSIDAAVSYMVLHHIPDPRKVLADAFRVLRPQGKLVIVELSPHGNEKMREKFSDMWLGFDHAEISQWAHTAGFEEVKTQALDPQGKAFLLTAFKPTI